MFEKLHLAARLLSGSCCVLPGETFRVHNRPDTGFSASGIDCLLRYWALCNSQAQSLAAILAHKSTLQVLLTSHQAPTHSVPRASDTKNV
jgi:hypothetical protein